MKVTSVQTVRDIEANVDKTIMSYDQMMLNAGNAAGEYLRQKLNITDETHITVLIGKGNNGSDGLVVAHYLSQNTPAQIRVYMLGKRDDSDENYQKVVDAGILVADAEDDHDSRLLKSMIRSADILVDALFGIGVRLPIRDIPAKIMRTVNQFIQPETQNYSDVVAIDPTESAQLTAMPKPFIFAIDCPSGINCDTGEADPNTIPADETMTFITCKHGQFAFPAAQFVGNLVLSQIGIPDDQPDIKNLQHFVMDNAVVKSTLPTRPADGHKGTFGKTFVVAGSKDYIGATTLSGESAYRSGTGLVTIATTGKNIYTIASLLREPTFVHLPDEDGAIAQSSAKIVKDRSDGYSALLVGCGMGQHPATNEFVQELLQQDDLPPLILDADALNILSQLNNWWEIVPENTIITPHPGEMARLTGLSIKEINDNRWEVASQKARDWNLIVVLKGAHTLVASPDGAVGVCPFKTDALGTAGTGDVLAGLIAGLRAQGASAFDSAVIAVYVHALAGKLAIDHVGNSRAVLAGDVLHAIGSAFKQIES